MTLINAGARSTYSDNPGYRNFINANMTYVAGSHDLRAGWQFDDSMNRTQTFSTSTLSCGTGRGLPQRRAGLGEYLYDTG